MIPEQTRLGQPSLRLFPSVFWVFPYQRYLCNSRFLEFLFFPRNEPPNTAKYSVNSQKMSSQ